MKESKEEEQVIASRTAHVLSKCPRLYTRSNECVCHKLYTLMNSAIGAQSRRVKAIFASSGSLRYYFSAQAP